MRADRKDYAIDGLVRLPARTRDIEIDYMSCGAADRHWAHPATADGV